jgi:hypothetical protein
MTRHVLKRNAGVAVIFSFAIFSVVACGIDDSIDVGTSGDVNDAGGDAALTDGSAGDAANVQDGSTGDATPDSGNDEPGLGPLAVDIGSPSDLTTAGAYILLAKTGITNATGSAVGGNLGVSPAKLASITGIAMTPDVSGDFETSPTVVAPGKIYASDNGDSTPANLTAAVLSMQAAYTDAAGRSSPDFLNLGSGDIGGKTLTPGLYSWGSGVGVTDNVIISGGPNDVWIFQITNDLDVSTGKSFTLSGGAQAKNIFWQVAGQVTIHANAHLEGVILSKTGITLQTTASVHGRALAQTLVALDNNAVTAP